MSEINPFDLVDYLADARERVTTQFKDKEVFDRFLQLLTSEPSSLQEVFQKLMQERSLDTAVGKQLDIIGEIVGQSRSLVIYGADDYFGFDTDVGSFPFSSEAAPTEGGTWLSDTLPVSGNIELDDDSYRLIIKARIAARTSSCTPQEIIDSLKFLVNSTSATLTETGNAHIVVGFGRYLSSLEKYLVKGTGGAKGIVPVPAGVSLSYYEYDADDVFGFNEDPTAKGFSDLSFVGYGYGYGDGYGIEYGGGEVFTAGGTFASLF